MIIITYMPGQLCNLLFLYSKFIAYSLEYGIKIKNPSFYQYIHYFKNTEGKGVPTFPQQNTRLNFRLFRKQRYFFWYYFARIIYKLKIDNRLIKCIYLDWNDTFDLVQNSHILKSKLILAQGWQFKAKELISKHQKAIIEYFEPKTVHAKIVNAFIDSLQTNTIKIGVHIRHGDYATFEEGKYYYSFEEYVNFMRRVQKLFMNKSIQFVICSNDKLTPKYFSEFNFSFGPNHEFEDMLVLSKCDYIIGPPSTYTMWASFYGNTPLAMLKTRDEKLSIECFKVYNEK